jgi:hypothetical protein
MCDKCVPQLCEHCFNPIMPADRRAMSLTWDETLAELLLRFVHGDCFTDFKSDQEAST